VPTFARTRADLRDVLSDLRRRLDAARPTTIGFPGAVDFDYADLAPLLSGQLLNNVGCPFVDGNYPAHTKNFERAVVSAVAGILRAPAGQFWGYVSSGGTESNLHALHQARRRYRNAVFYFSRAAHYSVEKAVEVLGVPSVTVQADEVGEIRYDDLAVQVARHRSLPAVVVANVGATWTEAVDDVRRIHGVLDCLGINRRWVHADAALSGIPLALVDPQARPGFDFGDRADSVAVSGHKFIGSPFPCGVVIVRTRRRRPAGVPYIASPDTTIAGSRSGHAPLVLWYALALHGIDGLRHRAEHSRMLAAYLLTRLTNIGWDAYRSHAHAFTVVFKTPPDAVLDRWSLPSCDGWSHVICMPGIDQHQIDDFVDHIAAAIRAPSAGRAALPTR
jgi:histidine decarboxylase